MIRKITVAAAAAGIALGGFAMLASPAGAAKPIITATGSVDCNITGKVKITPALTNQNTSPSTTVAKTKGTCTGTTESAVTPSGIKSTTTSVGTEPGTCNGLLTPGETPFTTEIKWKASGGKINPSTVVFPGVAPSGIGFALNDGDTTGSYAGTDNADAQANLDAVPDFSKCDPQPPKFKPAKGIKKLTIASGTFSIN